VNETIKHIWLSGNAQRTGVSIISFPSQGTGIGTVQLVVAVVARGSQSLVSPLFYIIQTFPLWNIRFEDAKLINNALE